MPYKDKTKKRLHDIWSHMRMRCNNKNNEAYKYYGDRGIYVCKQWEDSFYNFYNWALNNGYEENLTIDRIDVNGSYSPENCRWVTMKEQNNNKRSNHFITINGKTQTMQKWADDCNLNISTIYERSQLGVSEELLLLSVEEFSQEYHKNVNWKNGRYIEYNGQRKTITEWAKEYGHTREMLRNRINRDKTPIDKALTLSQEEYRIYRKNKKKEGILDG